MYGTDTVKVIVKTEEVANSVIKALDEQHRVEVGNDLRDNLIDLFNKYIPRNTGKLQARGYYQRVADYGQSVKVTIRYRNDARAKLNYVMYQYYGKVWAPNFAKFEGDKFVGWGSPRKAKGFKKYPTRRPIGIPRTVEIDKGKIVHITGYTKNKDAVPGWVEYCRNNAAIWGPFEKKQIEYVVKYFSKFMQTE